MSDIKKKLVGYLTRDDVELLEKASTRELKHKKKFIAGRICSECDYKWFYKSFRCPSCSSEDIKVEKKK